MALNEGLQNLLATTGGAIGGAAGMNAGTVIERLGELGSRPNNFSDASTKNQAIEILRRESGAAIPEGELQATMDMLQGNPEIAANYGIPGAVVGGLTGVGRGMIGGLTGVGRGMNTIGRMMQSPESKLFESNKMRTIMKLLRAESGAAIPQAEIDAVDQQYFPQPNDTPFIINQKSYIIKASIVH